MRTNRCRRNAILAVTVALALSAAFVSAGAAMAAEGPIPVSPGGVAGAAVVEARCPTFQWAGVPGARGYELAVFRLADDETDDGAEPVLVNRASVSGDARGFTPSSADCLERGGATPGASRQRRTRLPEEEAASCSGRGRICSRWVKRPRWRRSSRRSRRSSATASTSGATTPPRERRSRPALVRPTYRRRACPCATASRAQRSPPTAHCRVRSPHRLRASSASPPPPCPPSAAPRCA